MNTDHGFLLGEHDWLGKNKPPLYNEIVHLPCFIHMPGQPENQHRSALAQTLDIPATLLDYFGSINFGVGGNQRLFFLSIKKET